MTTSLERALVSLGEEAEFPPTPDLASLVVEEIGRCRRPVLRRTRLWPAFVTAVAVLCAAVMIVLPGARRAVADFLGIGGVRIGFEDLPPDPTAAGAGLGLGERVTLAEAEARAGFTLRFPAPDVLGRPDEVYVAEADGFVQVTFVYEPGEGLPAAPGRQEGLLFAQFKGRPEGAYLKKLVKAGAGVVEVPVRGTLGLWVEGPHELGYVGPDGTLRTDSTRLSAGALIWEEEGVTFRLESDLSKQRARELVDATR